MLKNINKNHSALKLLLLVAISVLISATPTSAQEEDTTQTAQTLVAPKLPRFNLHFQTTYIYQHKPAFHAAYDGRNSLLSTEEKENSLTATMYVGARLWHGAEFYINPELAGGSGLSGAFGLGAATNGETFRVGNPAPTVYLARAYFKQTFSLSHTSKQVEDQQNQVANTEPDDFLRIVAGKFSLGDFFDNNNISNSPRTQFLNWCLMNNGAYDFAANVRGYTFGAVTILQQNAFTYKLGFVALPTIANGGELNYDFSKSYSINAEASKKINLHGKTGNVRLTWYLNNANMGSYANALKQTGMPDVVVTRQNGNTKTGLLLNADLQLSKTAGLFARAGWNDGKNETWAFTEVDQSISGGISISGNRWRRKEDNLNLALVVNGLSQNHRDYLAAGGYGFQLGDGKLKYANESAIELFYCYKPTAAAIWLSADYQLILNPGYNNDRGPVNVFSFRLHAEL